MQEFVLTLFNFVEVLCMDAVRSN